MKIEKIKPIPKYIKEQIHKLDLERYPKQDGVDRFYSYLTKNDGELVKVTVAVKTRYKTHWHCKQVAVHGVDSERCFVKDMCFYYISGYHVGWYEEELTRTPKWYESPDWGWCDDKYFDPHAYLINKEYIAKFPEFKYSASNLADGDRILQYLRTYRKFPVTEYLLKLGLSRYVKGTQLLKRLTTNKDFRKWIARHRDELLKDFYYTQTIFKAFRENRSLAEVQTVIEAKKSLSSNSSYNRIKEVFQKDLERFFSYIGKQQTDLNCYKDYLTACEALGLDMTLERNRYPHDFKHWHDVRIDEYATLKAEQDAVKRKDLYEKFAKVAEKYLPLQRLMKEGYVCILAKSPAELVREGDFLHHCVGKYGYDQKFTREESLIFFVRPKDDMATPFVTLEYSLSKHSILQCYAAGNQKPEASVMDFVENKWLPYANRKLKKIAA